MPFESQLNQYNIMDIERLKMTVGIISETLQRKNADYGDSFAEIFREEGWPYAMGHLKEKLKRIDTLRKRDPEVVAENIADSLLDLAGYSILTYLNIDETIPKKGC